MIVYPIPIVIGAHDYRKLYLKTLNTFIALYTETPIEPSRAPLGGPVLKDFRPQNSVGF